jgi:hypothetical protein
VIWYFIPMLAVRLIRGACWLLVPEPIFGWMWNRDWACAVGLHYKSEPAGVWKLQCVRCGREDEYAH